MIVHILLLLGALGLSLGFLLLYVWAARDGQFTDLEEAKYQMFREDDISGKGDESGR